MDLKTKTQDFFIKTVYTGFLLFVLSLCFIQAWRDRSFWLDEAMIFDNMRARTTLGILVGGALNYSQEFPRVYLALISLITNVTRNPTFWTRLLPAVFGLAGVAAWLFFFYEFFWLKQTLWLSAVIAGGLLVANSYVLYYSFELKPYSADFFFSGFLFALYQTHLLHNRTRLSLIVLGALTSLLFSYTSLFVLVAIALASCLNADERAAWRDNKFHLYSLLLLGGFVSLFLYRVDIRFSEPPGKEGVLHAYWSDHFAQGDTAFQKDKSLLHLYDNFLMDWWRTEYGPMDEGLSESQSWYVLPYRTFKNPDIKHVLRTLVMGLVFITLGKAILGKERSRSALVPASLLVGILAFAAYFRVYPWATSRLTLFAMPVCLLLIVEVLTLISHFLSQWNWAKPIQWLLWAPFGWTIIRNGIFLSAAFTSAPFPENLNSAAKYISPSNSPFLVVNGPDDVIVRSYQKMPQGMTVLYESEMSSNELFKRIGDRPFYFLWVHYRPTFDNRGVPTAYARTTKAKEILNTTKERLGLLLLSPLSV